jgi:hypothetical protein
VTFTGFEAKKRAIVKAATHCTIERFCPAAALRFKHLQNEPGAQDAQVESRMSRLSNPLLQLTN